MKLPGPFKKKYTEKTLQRKIYRYIFLKKEADFVKKRIQPDGDKLKFELLETDEPKETLKRLKNLNKSIKRNKGRVSKFKFIALVILAGIIIIPSLLFLNPILEGVLERGLSFALATDVEIDGLRFNPFKGQLRISSFAARDWDDTGVDMVQTGGQTWDVDSVELLKGNIHLDTIAVTDIRFGVARDADVQEEQDVAVDSAKKAAGEGFSVPDAKEIFEQAKNSLAIDDELAELNEEFETAKTDLGNDADELGAEIDALKVKIDGFSMDFSDPAKITQSLTDLQELQSEWKALQGAYNGLTSKISELNDDYQQKVKQSFESSVDVLSAGYEGGVQLFSIDGALEAAGQDTLLSYYRYLQKALAIYSKLNQGNDTAEEDSEVEPVQRGTTLSFPKAASPRFWLKRLYISGTGTEIQAENFSSEPNIIGEAATVEGSYELNPGSLNGNLVLDGRSDAERLLYNSLVLNGVKQLEPFSYDLDAEVEMTMETLDSALIALAGTISEFDEAELLSMVGLDMDFELQSANIQLTARSSENTLSIESFSTNLFDGINLDSLLEDAYAEANSLLQDYLKEQQDEYLSGFDTGVLDSIMSGNLGDMNQLENQLAAYQKEYEQKAADAGSQVEDAVKDAVEGVKDAIKLPKVPGF
jgi:uncharacterized protein (TIGR03545 family)